MATSFNKVYKCFYSKITDDMYMELDKAETDALLQELLINALPWFEFPRVDINNYDLDGECFNTTLSNEEINIIATYMMQSWFDQQLASIENVRMKYSGSDFKFTSQANHMSKLLALKKDYERVGFHLQRLYKRRKADKNGIMHSTLSSIMPTSARKRGKQNIDSSVSGGDESCDDPLEWEDFGSSSDNNINDTTPSAPSYDSWESM